MAESVPENDEFLQIALAAHEAVKQQGASEATATTQAEPPKEEQPKVAESAAGNDGTKPVEAEKTAEAKVEAKAEEKKTDWKAAAAAERAKRAAKEQAKRLPTLEAENAAIRAELQRYKELESLKESDPLQAAEKFGLNYDRLTQEYIKSIEKNPNQPPPQVRALDQGVQKMSERIERLERELASERSQKAVDTFISGVKSVLAAKADEFELTKTADEGPELVKQISMLHWQQTARFSPDGRLLAAGEEMPIEEACRLAEKYFEQRQLKRFAETKKFQAMLKKDAPAPKKEEAPAPTPTAKAAPASSATLSQQLRQGGGEQTNFSGEWEELAALAKKLEAQQGN